MKSIILFLAINLFNAFANASGVDFIGEYSVPSVVRMFGYTAAECKKEGGELDDEACFIPSTNDISIQENSKNQKIVKIGVVYGPANMRDFFGVVTQTHSNTVVAMEADIDDHNVVGRIKRNGCRMTITLAGNSLKLSASKACDSNLLRADGAKRK